VTDWARINEDWRRSLQVSDKKFVSLERISREEKKGEEGGGRGGFYRGGRRGEGGRVRAREAHRAARGNAVRGEGSVPSLMTI
jgi:hypothetical protein